VTDLGSLRAAYGGELLTGEADLAAYSVDAAPPIGRLPRAAALVRSVDEVRRIVGWCAAKKVPFVARGAGTNLSGGCVPVRGGVVLSLARLDRILEVDTENEIAVVEPGVINIRLQEALAKVGRFYAPDPASYRICTLGGNVAENAGGPRCLRYGVTTDHVRALEAVMPDGSMARFSTEDAGPEIMSLLIGSEGTLGVVTKIWVDIVPLPETISTLLAAFPSLEAAMACVAETIASGILPRALEAMDRETLRTIEAAFPSGYPDAEALLLIEVEGSPHSVETQLERIRTLCARNGCADARLALDDSERDKLWEGRRSAYASMARKSTSISVEDGAVPRDKLPEALKRVREAAGRHGIKPALLFHAGDGNLHPNIAYDSRDPEQTARVKAAGQEMMKAYVEMGGTVSGEHGIGVEKLGAMCWQFTPESLDLMRRVKTAMDPDAIANPGKLIPEKRDRPCARPPGRLSEAARSLVDRVREKAGSAETIWLRGTGTKLPKDQAPGNEVEMLTARPLAGILDLDRGNYTATVEAGISPQELKGRLEPEGFYVPVPLLPGTLGGMLASKPWPGLRRGILGMKLLLSDGSITEFGGKSVKNVAGYDLPRLLLGSWGTLAIILEVTLKLSPVRPQIPNELAAPAFPALGPWHRRLKGAFDPENRLNPWRGQVRAREEARGA